MPKHKIIVQEQELPMGQDVRSFHVSIQICQAQGVCYNRCPQIYGMPGAMGELPQQPDEAQMKTISGETGHRLAQEILAIEGVTQVTMGPYSLDVTKGAAFEWEDLSPAITKVLLALFREQGISDVTREVRSPTPFEETPQGKAQNAQMDFFRSMTKFYEEQGGSE